MKEILVVEKVVTPLPFGNGVTHFSRDLTLSDNKSKNRRIYVQSSFY